DLSGPNAPAIEEDTMAIHHFILHQALDLVDHAVWKTQDMWLKRIDTFDHFVVSAFCTAGDFFMVNHFPAHSTHCTGYIKFLLLHKPNTNDESIRVFFEEVHELYLRALLNPLQEPNQYITNPDFDDRVRRAGRRLYLH
ncbi:hypothetical protein IE077_003529, partial [Cardiosporidium cionae]